MLPNPSHSRPFLTIHRTLREDWYYNRGARLPPRWDFTHFLTDKTLQSFHNPLEQRGLQSFPIHVPFPQGATIRVVVGTDRVDDSIQVVLAEPTQGVPIQCGLNLWCLSPYLQPFQHVQVGELWGFDSHYIVFTLINRIDRTQLPQKLAVPYSWAWIPEDEQIIFATHRWGQCDIYQPIADLFPDSVHEGYPFDLTLGRLSVADRTPGAIRRMRSLPAMHVGRELQWARAKLFPVERWAEVEAPGRSGRRRWQWLAGLYSRFKEVLPQIVRARKL